MKNIFLTLMILTFSLSSVTVFSQDNPQPDALGLPGDNLDLYAVLDLFQKSETIEGFETKLNEESTKINNLDLNNDKKTDFIKVVTKKEGDSFFVILQVVVNKNEIQDVAVINVFKIIDGSTTIQIIGDESLYGKNYIVEPNSDSVTSNPGYTGAEKVVIKEVVPVAAAPVVVYMYSPMYVPYYSPWYWGYYPPYWRPWVPMYYGAYWGYHGHYHGNPYYRRNTVVVSPHYKNNYYSNRSTSVTVNNYNKKGSYNTTYEGKNYAKASTRPTTTSPSTRPTTTNTKAVSPTTRPSTSTPTTRPTSPSTRPATTPTMRPVARPSIGRMR